MITGEQKRRRYPPEENARFVALAMQVESDHMMSSLEKAFEYALFDYGIEELDWCEMSQQEINRIKW